MTSLEKPDLVTTNVRYRMPSVHPEGRKFVVIAGAIAVLFWWIIDWDPVGWIVAGLTLLTLYGPQSPVGVNVAYSQVGIGFALLFITRSATGAPLACAAPSAKKPAERSSTSTGTSIPGARQRAGASPWMLNNLVLALLVPILADSAGDWCASSSNRACVIKPSSS